MKKTNKLLLLFSIFISIILCFSINVNAQTTSGNVYVPKEVESKIMIPTAFSPNNDGNNDEFKMVNITNEILIEMRVFNRWGTVVYSSSDIHKGWDGRHKGQEQPMGVYGYIIKIKKSDGTEDMYRGTVTLIR